MKNTSKILFLGLAFLLSVDTLDAQRDQLMLGKPARYRKVAKKANMSPFIDFRVDTALQNRGLRIDKIGYRQNQYGMLAAFSFRQPVPDLEIYINLVIFDETGRYMISQATTFAVNRYRTLFKTIWLDYLPAKGHYAVLHLISSKKIEPAKNPDDVEAREKAPAKWIAKPIPEPRENEFVPQEIVPDSGRNRQ